MHPLIETNRENIAQLCRRYGVTRLEVFGSILRSDFNPSTSDVDVLAEFGMTSNGSPLGEYFNFKAGLEQLFGRPVDVVSANGLRNPYVRRAVENSKVGLDLRSQLDAQPCPP